MSETKFSHITGTFLIQAEGSFLNGAGLGDGEDRNVTVPKTFSDRGDKVPYVSSQAWKRWLRNTFIEETGFPKSELRAIGISEKGTANKIAGELNPVEYPEDDIFGYMEAKSKQGKKYEDEDEDNENDVTESKKKTKIKAVIRSSPFVASLLISLRKKGWKGRDEGFVHLKEGNPLPYTTEFYNTNLQAVFCLAYNRIGVFSNIGDRIELEESKAEKFLKENKIVKEYVESGKDEWVIYELMNVDAERKKRVGGLIRALSMLRGGAKQAAFGTDVTPKILLIAGMDCGNPVFNHLFEDAGDGVKMKVDTFIQVISDFKERIKTPVYLGIRKGYLINEDELISRVNEAGMQSMIKICSPVEAANLFVSEELK